MPANGCTAEREERVVAVAAVFASLSTPNYRRYFAGGLVSNCGNWMSRTAATWLVLVELTRGDMTAIGLLSGLMFLPALLLSPLAGALADRLPKRRIMITAQTVSLANAALLGALTLSHTIELWHVFALTLVDGCAGALDSPARQAFVRELVAPAHLSNAIGLNSASWNAARLIGPGLAGVLIAGVGTGPVFLTTVAAYAVMVIMLARLDTSLLLRTAAPAREAGGVREGLRYVRGRPDLVALLAVGFMMGNFAFNFAISNPAMSTMVFGKGPTEFGALGSLMGLGALGAALLAAARTRPRLRYIVGAMAGYVVCQGASGVSPTFELFAALQVPIGLCAITAVVTANMLLQTSLADEIRGRVMSLWMLALLGATPLVSPLVGWVGTVLGPRATVQVGTLAIGATVVVFVAYVMAHDGVRLRLQLSARRPVVIVHPVSGPRVDSA